MTRSFKAIVATILALVVLAFAGSSVLATQGEDHKVGLCHRTASDTNPYVFIEVDVAALSPGHLDNADPGHKPTFWKSDVTFRGVAYADGDAKDDYLAEAEADCNDIVVDPTPTPTPDPICLEDGGTQACGPLVPCEFYETVFVKVDGVPTEVTVNGVYVPEGFSCDEPTVEPTPTPVIEETPAESPPAATIVPDTAMTTGSDAADLGIVLGAILLAMSLGATAYRALILYRLR